MVWVESTPERMAIILRTEAEKVGLRVEKEEEGAQKTTERSHRERCPLHLSWHKAHMLLSPLVWEIHSFSIGR